MCVAINMCIFQTFLKQVLFRTPLDNWLSVYLYIMQDLVAIVMMILTTVTTVKNNPIPMSKNDLPKIILLTLSEYQPLRQEIVNLAPTIIERYNTTTRNRMRRSNSAKKFICSSMDYKIPSLDNTYELNSANVLVLRPLYTESRCENEDSECCKKKSTKCRTIESNEPKTFVTLEMSNGNIKVTKKIKRKIGLDCKCSFPRT